MSSATYTEGMKADVENGLICLTLDIQIAEWIVSECCSRDEITKDIARQVVRAALSKCPESAYITETTK